MDYAYKVTTHGRAAMAAYMALGTKPFNITRVAFGSGLVEADVNLADIHELLEYVSEGAVADRGHQDDRLQLTIQFANQQHPEVKTFLLSEFIVYVENPETGAETDLLYGTLGDYREPVPAYNPAYPPSVFNFPLELILSDEIRVNISAPAGLATWDEILSTLADHNADPNAHGGRLGQGGRKVLAVREREAGRPTYGLDARDQVVALKAGPCTGGTEVSAIVSGVEYDAENMSASGDNAPDGTLILRADRDST